MKKFISIILTLVLVLSLCACGKRAKATNYSLGDTVSTELADFKLNYAKMSIEAFNYYYNTTIREAIPKNGENIIDLKENAVLTAAKGHTYVFLDYSMTNLDRTDIDGFSLNYKIFYNSEEIPNESVVTIENIDLYRSYIYQDSTLYPSVNERPNQKISANETRRYRQLIDISTEVASVDDAFTVEITLNDVNAATKSFNYEITAESILNSEWDFYYNALENPQNILTDYTSVAEMNDEQITAFVSGITEDTVFLKYEDWLSPGLIKFEQGDDGLKVLKYSFLTGTGSSQWSQLEHTCEIKDGKLSLGEYGLYDFKVKDIGKSWYLLENGKSWILINPSL